jgi:hypothetical protein
MHAQGGIEFGIQPGGCSQMNTDNVGRSSSARRYGLLFGIWTVLVSGSLVLDLLQESRNTLSTATVAARANISKDIGFRRWATSHGGT